MNVALDALIRAIDDMRWIRGMLPWGSVEEMELGAAAHEAEEAAADAAWKLWKSTESIH